MFGEWGRNRMEKAGLVLLKGVGDRNSIPVYSFFRFFLFFLRTNFYFQSVNVTEVSVPPVGPTHTLLSRILEHPITSL